jgi:hypothetical protein
MFGPGMEIELRDSQTTADCYSDEARFVTVRSSAQPAARIVLHRLVSDDAEVSPALCAVVSTRRANRAAAEERHNYRAAFRRLITSDHA